MANGQGSAGVAIREYEVTGPVGTPPPLGIPAGVIGTALRGPAFVPVTVGSNAAFRLKFGGTDGKKFGPLAINEWMVNSGGRAATYLRVLGAGDCRQRNEDGTVTKAGFVVGSELPSGSSGELDINPFANSTQVIGGIPEIPAVAAQASIVLSSITENAGVAPDGDESRGFGIVDSFGNEVVILIDPTGGAGQTPHGFAVLLEGDTVTGSGAKYRIFVGTNGGSTGESFAEQIEEALTSYLTSQLAGYSGTRRWDVEVSRSQNTINLTQGTAGQDGNTQIVSYDLPTVNDSIEVNHFTGGEDAISETPATTYTADPGRVFFLGAEMTEKDDFDIFSSSGMTAVSGKYPIVRGVLFAPSGVILKLKEDSSDAEPTTLIAADNDSPLIAGSGTTLGNINESFVLFLNGLKNNPTYLSASFDPTSDSYFAKVLNTDPLKIQERGHYLYASWDVVPSLANSNGKAFIYSGSLSYNSGSALVPNFENWEDRFSHPVTPWVVSQRFGTSSKNLFRLHSLDDGEGAATSYKFSIENLVPGNPEIAGGFGTFDLLIRDWNDTDADPVILESFRGLTLDPRSDKYVARAIGNSYRRFDFDRTESEQKLVDEIDHPMGSNLVRVEMDYSYEEGNIEPSALPMGFRGVNHLNTRGTLSGDVTLIPHISTPPVPMRFNLVVGAGTRSRLNSDLFWGMQFENISGSTEPNSPPAGDLYRNRSLEAFTKFFPSHLTEIAPVWKVWTKEGESDLDSFCNNGFSLEKIFVVENAGDTSTPRRADPSKWNFAKYLRDGQAPSDGTLRALNVNDLTLPKNRRHAKFTFVMQGGFNGVNIFNADMSDMTNKAVTQEVDNQSRGRTDGPTVRAYLKSIDIMKNTVNSDLQLLAIPGIRNSSVTEVAADAVRDRFDALYLMDVEQKSTLLGADELPQDVSEGEQDLDGGLRVSVAATVSHFEERDMDNSFAAAYFPDVVVTDPGTGGNVTVPPSVVVLGAMALNDRVGHPWFAPAGVTRGALASTQRAKVSLSKANLDALYNVGINPLTPPSAGLPVTVWGQKTLQAGNSALNRVNVRRLLIEIRRQVRDIAQTIIFEPNRAATLARFTAAVTPRLQRIQALSGLDRFRVVIDSSTTTQQDVENNTIRGKIFVQPTKSIEYVSLDFVVSNSGAQV